MSAAAAAAPAVKAKKPVGPLVTAYLLAYNLVAAGAWAYVLYLIADTLVVQKRSYASLYAVIHRPLYLAQTMAIMEILHSMFGFVKSPVFTTAIQVASRLLLVWGIYFLVPSSRFGYGFMLATTSWSLVEVPRYLFYAVSLLSTPAYWQKFIRYSLFLVLYPSGISGEVLSIVSALPEIASKQLLAYPMPNRINFSFDYTAFLYFILATYIPGSYIMYTYMLAQRKKQLNPPTAATAAKKAQ